VALSPEAPSRSARFLSIHLEYPWYYVIAEENSMTQEVEMGLKRIGVTMSKPVMALIAIVFGILVIAFKDLLQWIVGLYFIIQGILFFIDYFELRRK
jgi:uncharacterized membrane protein HdeD (DUF308 family)